MKDHCVDLTWQGFDLECIGQGVVLKRHAIDLAWITLGPGLEWKRRRFGLDIIITVSGEEK